MGETARRIMDSEQVKIGTCNEMWNCRLDQLKEVEYGYKTDDLLWRIPWPEEDGTEPGDYHYPIVRTDYVPWQLRIDTSGIEKYPLIKESGSYQLWDRKSGLTVSIKCLHGLALPERTDSAQFYWNGKADVLHLAYINNTPEELLICVQCRCCKKLWGFSWNEIGHLISSKWMQLRLFHLCNEYWFGMHPGRAGEKYVYSKERPSCIYGKDKKGLDIWLISDGPDSYQLKRKESVIFEGTWKQVRDQYIDIADTGGEEKELRERYLWKK